MTITNVSTTYLKATATEIALLIADPTGYTKMEVTATKNCGTAYTQTFSAPFTATANLLLLSPDSIRLNPTFFGLTELDNGVYKVTVKIFEISPAQTILISNCALVDIDVTCQVAAMLHNLIGEYEDKTLTEKPSIIAHVLHYALVNGSNCGCNCAEMCQVYDALIDILTNIDPKLLADCGC